MGEYADEMIDRMIWGPRRRRVNRPEPTAEERRAYAEARHDEMLDDLIDELPGDDDADQTSNT